MIGRAVDMRQARRVAPARREMSIERALVWAFQTECASVDFAEEAAPDSYRRAISSAWLVAQRGAIGCRIDGGGHSLPADDAEMIASAVAALPPEHGGRGMAVKIASLARASMRPDWMPDARPRCVPREWHMNPHGRHARKEVVGEFTIEHRGRKLVRKIEACPVTYVPSQAQIAAARREWLTWWGALLHLGHEINSMGLLETIALTRDMPPMTPWRAQEG
ncbi:hypothetical protein EBL87_16310 [Cereibacter sphaeroides]|uniref:hypothetical protein n=1 Tax=Cereibacter sphaeroides TaxID=1063 RepID=UPI000F53FA2C|nr:hypothetical protein [Cereibacter sphaeroides]AZB65325.1 hypothetical protein EBL87_16310 [Cereibacter sphaeroides]AZB70163.1 hypothetical protein EBL86_17330 [Cereibacter sphaeroides]